MPQEEKNVAIQPAADPIASPPGGEAPRAGAARPKTPASTVARCTIEQDLTAMIDAASKRPSKEGSVFASKRTVLTQSAAEKNAAAEAARAEATEKRLKADAGRSPYKTTSLSGAPAPYVPDGVSIPAGATPLDISPSAVLAAMEAPPIEAPAAVVPSIDTEEPDLLAFEDADDLFLGDTQPDSADGNETAKPDAASDKEVFMSREITASVSAILSEVSEKRKQKKPVKRAYTRLTAFGRMMARSGSVVVKNPFFRGVGNMLYLLGFYAECKVLQTARLLRDIGIVTFHILKWMFGSIGAVLGAFFGAVWHDLSAPFVHMGRAIVNVFRFAKRDKRAPGVREGVTAREYLRSGLKLHGHLLGNLAMFLLPLAALIVLVTVVQSVLSMKYALAVKVNDDTIGYVADQSVFEDAKNMLRSRLRLSGDQQMADFQLNASLMLAKTDTFTSKDQIVNEALRSGAFDVVPATGLYINDRLYAATTEGEKLDAFLDDMLESYRDPSMPDAEVRFRDNVVCEPNPDDIYLDSTVESYDTIVSELTKVIDEEKRYTTSENETLGDIATRNNMQYEVLAARNPELESISPDEVLPAGTNLLLHSARPFLQVETSVRFESVETIPFGYVEQDDPERPIGVRSVTQQGEEGEQRVYEDYVFIDGELVSQTRVDELTEVITSAVDEITVVGTGDPKTTAIPGSDGYINPIPDSHVSSRGMSGGHRGRDYNAPTGTPIYAANGGVVEQATYHYSWGNMVLIRHADGNATLYAHMDYFIVGAGQAVAQGQQIGVVGMTGNTSGPHLHLEVWAPGGGLIDPDSIIPYSGAYGWG